MAAANVIQPNGGINQNQTGLSMRRRGAGLIEGCVTPSRASRFALSRSMSAFKPSFKMAVLSIGPASWAAFASNSSSIFTVVRSWRP